jgi:hypothetical protein
VRLLSEHAAERPARLDRDWPAVVTHTHNWRFREGETAGTFPAAEGPAQDLEVQLGKPKLLPQRIEYPMQVVVLQDESAVALGNRNAAGPLSSSVSSHAPIWLASSSGRSTVVRLPFVLP